MSKIRLYLECNFTSKIKMTKEVRNYLLKVMRLSQGDLVRIFNQIEGEWLAIIEDNYLIPKEKIKEISKEKIQIILAFAPTKGQIELVLEKATELACDLIIPIITERSIIRKINEERCQKILLEASEQTGRIIPPKLFGITELAKVPEKIKTFVPKSKFLLFHPNSSGNWQDIKVEDQEALVLILGPEGGFTEADLEAIPEKTLLSLGENILRAETANLVAMTLAKIILKQL